MRRDWASRSALSPLPCPFQSPWKFITLTRPRGRRNGDELHVARVTADVAFRDIAALAVDEHVAGIDDVETLRDQRHQPVVVEVMRVEEGLRGRTAARRCPACR